jgi:hypothetical protein
MSDLAMITTSGEHMVLKEAAVAALKNKYDPTNFFRLNHNIKPTG